MENLLNEKEKMREDWGRGLMYQGKVGFLESQVEYDYFKIWKADNSMKLKSEIR